MTPLHQPSARTRARGHGIRLAARVLAVLWGGPVLDSPLLLRAAQAPASTSAREEGTFGPFHAAWTLPLGRFARNDFADHAGLRSSTEDLGTQRAGLEGVRHSDDRTWSRAGRLVFRINAPSAATVRLVLDPYPCAVRASGSYHPVRDGGARAGLNGPAGPGTHCVSESSPRTTEAEHIVGPAVLRGTSPVSPPTPSSTA